MIYNQSLILLGAQSNVFITYMQLFPMMPLTYHVLTSIRFPLVNRFYKNHYPSGKAKRDEIIWIGESSQALICAVRFQCYADYQLMTGMAVHSEHRNQGIASALLKATQSQLKERSCYCFAFSHLSAFYQTHGFKIIDTQELPSDLRPRFERYNQHGKTLIAMQYQS